MCFVLLSALPQARAFSLPAAPPIQSPVATSPTCAEAAAQAEAEAALPKGLLLAVGRVESGRPDPAGGPPAPWPWTTDEAGAGHFFASRAAAIAWTEAEQARGMQSIDIGCFQVNLHFHPEAFANLQEGFSPLANARAAARILRDLYEQTHSWSQAVALYHSADPTRGGLYRDRVMAAWMGDEAVASAAPAPISPEIIHIGPAIATGPLPRVITPRG